MSLSVVVFVIAIVLIGWLAAYMLAQKPVTTVQKLIQQRRYAEAAAEVPRDAASHLHRAEALKLLGRFEEAIEEYRRSDDPAAREGIALSLAHLGRNLDDARRMMEQTIATHPQIQEFQALGLAYILLKRGDRDEALRLFDDNRVLLETRFKDDYTDPDPLLAETLWMYAALSEAAGDPERATALRARAGEWAGGGYFALSPRA